MKKIIKNFSDFSYIREDFEGGEETTPNVPSEVEPAAEPVMDQVEEEESPLSQVSEETGLPIQRDEKGEFIETEDGDVIRYYSETGYYNETKKKKYGEEVAEIVESIQFKLERVSHRGSCRTGCGCKRK